ISDQRCCLDASRSIVTPSVLPAVGPRPPGSAAHALTGFRPQLPEPMGQLILRRRGKRRPSGAR
ncbi:hypothetical protein ABTX86_28235, partial [Streptomyces anulatus]|uniref:hypothetical protein n=1 Tax=Streptomyces anulatus TaxID=1892 RepID=UPI00331A4021